jgi:hypothetical protein
MEKKQKEAAFAGQPLFIKIKLPVIELPVFLSIAYCWYCNG